MNHWSKAKKIGWWIFVAWTVLVTVVMSWGMPLFAMPSAAQLMLLLELVGFGFVTAFGVSVVIEAWTQMVRRHC
ncbi:hypothetical protein [Burkholderia vietnamiensis]|uniref:hypothetical protein n=1 Tax=Burkholderia vietnamiensis TaxID=60552 RepID=UPI00075C87F7|nr:hypothetical protein [Burkholderia vietnamiensis]KVR92528.1 hypothetical protein WK27_00060 [Burkholderia vietnamiensis]MCA8073945.1 hypothetical protein [Burkholderia vietnamiensis]